MFETMEDRKKLIESLEDDSVRRLMWILLGPGAYLFNVPVVSCRVPSKTLLPLLSLDSLLSEQQTV